MKATLLCLLAAAACGGAQHGPSVAETVEQTLANVPPYREVEADAALSDAFGRYFAWMQTLDIPDMQYLAGLPPHDLERLAMMHHEKVELRGWMKLGHKLPDIMTKDYYQQKYMEVYPVAHAEAMAAELGVVAGFAERRGLGHPSLRAFALVTPMVERRGVPAAMADRRLRFNPDIAAQKPTRAELEAAAAAYQAGGYRYKDLAHVIDDALAVVAK